MESNYRIYSLLDSLNKKFGPHDFGRLCQILLAITFKTMGYKVSPFQLSGRPDMVVVKEDKGFCIEVKAPTCNQVTLKKEDIEGVCNQGYLPIICINTYPEVKPKWIFLDANKIKHGTYRSTSLEKYNIKDIQAEINNTFSLILEKYHENGLNGVDCLRRILEEK